MELNSIKDTLSLEFNMTDMGKLKAFLGVKIDIRSDGIFLSQRVYIQNLLKRFGMENCDPIRTPFEKGQAQVKHDEDAVIEEKPYRELVGCLSYLTLNTRPDICAAVNYYSRFQSSDMCMLFEVDVL
ncbi:Reverse transcriptase (RNA-dependent DNA polymerase) [Popillia japonica]|uniref:Reverse transcriptase (RNA-dependent DNA polymerase) n=1 Tax=Popillia japonica TaxID=7064 RepID=A0AAW1N4G4_POPJA